MQGKTTHIETFKAYKMGHFHYQKNGDKKGTSLPSSKAEKNGTFLSSKE